MTPVADSETAPSAVAGSLGLGIGLSAVGVLPLVAQMAPGYISARVSVRAAAYRGRAKPRAVAGSLAGVSLAVRDVDLWRRRRGRRAWPAAGAASSQVALAATGAAVVAPHAGRPVW